MTGIPALAGASKRKSKFGNVRCELDGFSFDSKRERDHYAGNLKLREMAGEIRGLSVHPIYPIKINDIFICNVEMDFAFTDIATGMQFSQDVKGFDNPLSKLKRRLLEACYPNLTVEIIR